MVSKNSTKKSNFYLSILNTLKTSTNLSNIQKDLSISKQQLNFYLRNLKKDGYIIKKGRGWYEVTDKSKNLTKYDNLLSKDIIRGHAYIWTIKLPKIKDWEKRIEILTSKGIHFNLVGAKLTTPRIKVLGRKVWLCNDHLRIFDKKGNSYYGKNAIEVRNNVLNEVSLIIGVLERKLGVFLDRIDVSFKKEHYALIKNDLAIEHNQKGEQLHISDNFGEWLLIDDSLGEGGELENIGKKSFVTNIPMQKWWNNQKETGFKVTPSFLMESIGGLVQTQQMNADNIIKHQKVLDEMLITLKQIRDNLK